MSFLSAKIDEESEHEQTKILESQPDGHSIQYSQIE